MSDKLVRSLERLLKEDYALSKLTNLLSVSEHDEEFKENLIEHLEITDKGIAQYERLYEQVSPELIQKGFEAGLVKLIDCPDGDEIVAKIDDLWFYFDGGEDNEEYETPKEYLGAIGIEGVSQMIATQINYQTSISEDEYEAAEWLYYKYYLEENLV